MGLEFVDDLPRPTTGKNKTAILAAELRANPGKWARWPTRPTLGGLQRSLDAQGDGFEVASRKVDGKYVKFARFVGEEPEGPEVALIDSPALDGPRPVVRTVRGEPVEKVKCRACGHFFTVLPDSTAEETLEDHYVSNLACRAASRRRR